MSFQDKVAIVTGGSRGIRTRDCAGAGSSRSQSRVHVCSEQGALPPTADSVAAYQADVTSFEQAKRTCEVGKGKFGRIDILVNNAGITRDKLILRMSEKDWDDVMDTNLKGAFNVSKPVVAAMVSQRSGTILNITSISGIVGMPGQVNYSSLSTAVISVSTKPKARALTVMLALAISFASALVKPIIPAFDEE